LLCDADHPIVLKPYGERVEYIYENKAEQDLPKGKGVGIRNETVNGRTDHERA
jgi:hypothetical protein